MSSVGNVMNAGQIDSTEFHPTHEGKKIKQASDNSASASDQAPAPRPANNSPTDGAREATTGKPPGYAEVERLTEERLMSDPEYRALKEKLDMCAGLEDMFLLIDQHVGIANNRLVCLDDILALVNDTNAPNKGARDAAKWLNDHRAIWAAIAKDDNLVRLDDVKEFLAAMKAELKGMKEAVRSEVKAEVGAATALQGASVAQTGTQTGTAVMAEAGRELPKPPPSQFTGLEGASENMNNMIGWGESEIDRLTALMGKTNDPAELKQLENKINQMSRRMQQMTALMNQIMTAMQNISKMYSDIAMNSVRNMK